MEFVLSVDHGSLPCRSVGLELASGTAAKSTATVGKKALSHQLRPDGALTILTLSEEIRLDEGQTMRIMLAG